MTTAEQIELRTQQIASQQLGDLVIACARLRAEAEALRAEIAELKSALEPRVPELVP